MYKNAKHRGTALIIVLVFSAALLIFGSHYLKSISYQAPINPFIQQKMQADFLAEGLSNIAILKFKELPSDFYYAYYLAKVATTTKNTEPLSTFENDTWLRGSVPDPNNPKVNASYTTYFQVLSQKKYERDTILITTIVDLGDQRREVKKTIFAERHRLAP